MVVCSIVDARGRGRVGSTRGLRSRSESRIESPRQSARRGMGRRRAATVAVSENRPRERDAERERELITQRESSERRAERLIRPGPAVLGSWHTRHGSRLGVRCVGMWAPPPGRRAPLRLPLPPGPRRFSVFGAAFATQCCGAAASPDTRRRSVSRHRHGQLRT